LERNNTKTLWYAAELQKKIRQLYSDQLNQVPAGWSQVAVQSVIINSSPTFIEKNGQKLTFSTKVIYGMEATKFIQRSPPDYTKLMSHLLGPVHSTQLVGPHSVV